LQSALRTGATIHAYILRGKAAMYHRRQVLQPGH